MREEGSKIAKGRKPAQSNPGYSGAWIASRLGVSPVWRQKIRGLIFLHQSPLSLIMGQEGQKIPKPLDSP